jgi:hypothetical protein
MVPGQSKMEPWAEVGGSKVGGTTGLAPLEFTSLSGNKFWLLLYPSESTRANRSGCVLAAVPRSGNGYRFSNRSDEFPSQNHTQQSGGYFRQSL